MILNEQDSGRTVTIDLGEPFIVSLKENPTTGYRWMVETHVGLEKIGDSFIAGGALGGVGLREFQFRSVRAGTYELRLRNWREWEGEGSVITRFIAKIKVQ